MGFIQRGCEPDALLYIRPRAIAAPVTAAPRRPGCYLRKHPDVRAGVITMPTQLKPVDVAVIGLGAAGGVAVLPLARAGLTVAGIEAGTWMGPKDYRADEIHNNVRRRVTSVPKDR